MNRYKKKCPHTIKCIHLDEVTDRCTWNEDCLRDKIIKEMKKINKKK